MKLIDFIKEFTYQEPRDEAHYRQLMKDLQDIQKDPKQYAIVGKLNFMKRKAALDAWAEKNLKKENMSAEPAKCTHCDGTGKHGDKECSVCGGRGYVTEDGVQPTDMKRVGAMGKTLYVHKDGKTIMIPADREKEFIAKGFKKSALRTEETNEGAMRMDKTAFVQMLANKIKEPQKGHGRPEFDNRLLAKMYKLITGADVEFEGDKFTVNMNTRASVDEDISPEKEDEFHVELDKLVHKYFGHSSDEKKKKKTETAVEEGASMIPYYKTEKDWDGEKRVVWEFPKTWANDKELDTPYMSNASMRQFLSALGYPADFEDMSAVPVEEFIGVTTQWLKKNIGKQSPEEEPEVDDNPGGPTMISGGRPEGYMNRQVKLHNELARKIKAKYPEVTHLGFN